MITEETTTPGTDTPSPQRADQVPATTAPALIAGKYKTEADLVRAIGSLGSKMGYVQQEAGKELGQTDILTGIYKRMESDFGRRNEPKLDINGFAAEVAKSGVDMNAVFGEYVKDKKINDGAKAKLSALFDRMDPEAKLNYFLEREVANATHIAEKGQAKAHSAAGGQEKFVQLLTTAKATMPESEWRHVETALANPEQAENAVYSLMGRLGAMGKWTLSGDTPKGAEPPPPGDRPGTQANPGAAHFANAMEMNAERLAANKRMGGDGRALNDPVFRARLDATAKNNPSVIKNPLG